MYWEMAPIRKKCRAYGRELNIDDRIVWYGWQQHPWKLVQQDIKKVSALLLTSSFEGFPMTLLEALSWDPLYQCRLCLRAC